MSKKIENWLELALQKNDVSSSEGTYDANAQVKMSQHTCPVGSSSLGRCGATADVMPTFSKSCLISVIEVSGGRLVGRPGDVQLSWDGSVWCGRTVVKVAPHRI